MAANNGVAGWGTFNMADGAAVCAGGDNRPTVARTAAGVYTLTFTNGFDSTESALFGSVITAVDAATSFVHTSDTVKTMRTWTANTGAALDAGTAQWLLLSLFTP